MNNIIKKVGIIGGAGPAASALLYEKIIKKCQQEFGCSRDSDFPEIVIINYPFSEMLSGKNAKKYKLKIRQELQYCFDKLNNYGADVVIIACNTLHTFLDEIVTRGLDLAHLSNSTIDTAASYGLKNVFVLGTQQTVKAGLYFSENIKFIQANANQQAIISEIIDNILAGKLQEDDAIIIGKIIFEVASEIALQNSGQKIDGVILGCTELSVLVNKFPIKFLYSSCAKIVVLDPLDIIINKLMEKIFSKGFDTRK